MFFGSTKAADRQRCLLSVAEDNSCNTTVQAFFYYPRRLRFRCERSTIHVCNTTIPYYQDYNSCVRGCRAIRPRK
uniref:SFRICE_015613 n=1 Tax=Spodoptera frugiperda TaxID=7108 RepID=A0A2H1V8H6_SPOFR